MEYRREDIFRQISNDTKLKEEILDRISSTPAIGAELVEPYVDELPSFTKGVKGIQIVSEDQKVDDARRILENPNESMIPEDLALEAIIRRLARPVLKISNDDFDESEADTQEWQKRLKTHKKVLKQALVSVGRIELENNPNFSWVGTGWVIAEDLIVTNRHVANIFAQSRGQRFVFRKNLFGVAMEARIDFHEEHQGANPDEFAIKEVLHVEEQSGPDIAFLRIDWNGTPSGDDRDIIQLSENVSDLKYVAAIGYPAKDTRTNIPVEMDAIFANIYDVKRLAPGELMSQDESRGFITHDCTTLGGNSGSVIIELETGKAAGLHFAGREEFANYAVSASLVNERLQAVLGGRGAILPDIRPTELDTEAAPKLKDMDKREGYTANFLGKIVPLPKLSSDLAKNIAPVTARKDGMLNYTHYSLLMHASRRFAIYTATNIDGKLWRNIPRGSSDKWYFDPRMDSSFQVGNDVYKSNRLDRGHLVRRLDPVWGRSYGEAVQAEKDTFFYTNCAPQHDQMNRKTWLGLEDYILKNSKVHDLKVSVFSGPVFRESDRPYRGIKIPEDYWKVVVVINDESGSLAASAYLLTQLDLLDDLEFAFGAYGTYQVPLSQIEELTHLDFGDLSSHDPMAALESSLQVTPLTALNEIKLWDQM